MRLRTLVAAVCVSGTFHNGSVFRNSVPLRKRDIGEQALAGSGKCGGGYLMPKVSSGHVPVGSMWTTIS